MTPEEILAECPELRYGQGLFWLAGKQHVYVNGEVATAWATSRKEARELREQNTKLVFALRHCDDYVSTITGSKALGKTSLELLIQEALLPSRSTQNV